jgi:hypothetical protein
MISVGGYRSMVIIAIMAFALVFYFEGLMRSRLMPFMVLTLVFMGGLTVCFSDKLPLSVQRGLAFLPLKIDPVARLTAQESSDWRVEIWQSLLPQVPKYLLFGKGLGFDVNDWWSYQTLGNQQVGGDVGGGLTLSGDYHNGPLSLIIPFGIWGAIGFLWFLAASFRVLWRNYKYGDPDLRRINTFLLGYFIAKVIMFFFVFGGFYADLMQFTGIVGLAISMNGGVAKPAPEPRPQVVFHRFRLVPEQNAAVGG